MSFTTRTRTRLLTGVIAGAVLAVGVPLAASAHIHVSPERASADASTNLTFSFSHGCDDSPTTALAIDIPEGVTNVTPVVDAGWTITRDVADNGAITRVTFTATTPVETGLKGEVSFDARFAAELAQTAVAFPVTQQCVVGETAWTEVAAEGEAEPESPAPLVSVGDVVAGGEDGHDVSGAGHDAADEEADAAAADTASAAETNSNSTAVWLGGAGLALGVIALGVAVAAFVRRRA